MVEWLGLEGTFIIQLQPFCQGQEQLPLDHTDQSPIQSGLEQCQGWGITSSLCNWSQFLSTLTFAMVKSGATLVQALGGVTCRGSKN